MSRTHKKRSRKGGLSRWFAEEWVDVCTGRPCGRRKGSKRRMPYCRPKRRVSGRTPKTRRQLSKKRLEQCVGKKEKLPKKNKNVV